MQGLHARIKRHPNRLIFTSTTNDGEKQGPFSIPMRKKVSAVRAPSSRARRNGAQDLLEAAQAGDFFSYIAGVAYKIMIDHQVSVDLCDVVTGRSRYKRGCLRDVLFIFAIAR